MAQPQLSARAAYAARKAAEEAAAPHPLLRAPTPPPVPTPPPRKRRKGEAAASTSAPATPAASRRESAVSSGADETSADEELPPTPGSARVKKAKVVAEASLCAPGSWTPNEEGQGRQANWAYVEQSKSLMLAMRQGETLTFAGTARVHLVQGCLTLLGARLVTGKSAIVFAPKSSPLPVLSAQIAPSSSKQQWSDSIPPRLRSVEFDAYIRLEALLDTGVELLGRVCPVAGLDPFGPVAVYEPTSATPVTPGMALFQAQQLPGLHPVLAQARSVSALSLSPSWKRTLDSLARAPGAASMDGNSLLDLSTKQVFLVRGPKRAGKSTFARLALSALLSSTAKGGSVAWLDADLGQPEFGPPGLVSLHVFESNEDALRLGPGWTASHAPLRAHFIGASTPRDDPQGYIAALEDLTAYFQRHVQHTSSSSTPTPLIVNTQGWVKGLGADLAARLEHLVVPTFVFDLQPAEEFDASNGAVAIQEVAPPYQGAPYLDAQGGTLGQAPIIVPLSSVASTGAARLTAADARVLSIMSHLHAVPAAADVPRWNFTRTLCETPPLRVDVAQGFQAGVHVLSFGASIAPALALAALNGSIVAIVRVDTGPESNVLPIAGLSEPWATALAHPPPTPRTSTCLGLALIRSIDVSSGTLNLLTSIAASSLALAPAQRLALVKGSLETPLWANLDTPHVSAAQSGVTPPELLAGTPIAEVPYVEWPDERAEAGAVGAGKRRVRRNLMRKGQRG